MGEVFRPGARLSLLMPTGVTGLVKGSPVRVGGVTGVNGVLTSNVAPDPATETVGLNTPPETAGGNLPGYASVDLSGVHDVECADAVDLYGALYIVLADMTITTDDGSGSNPQFGVAMSAKAAGAGTVPALIK